MTSSSPATLAPRRSRLRIPAAIALALLLTGVFVVLLFPWDSLSRRVTHELARASGGRLTIAGMGPAWTARGPVLRARDVRIAHPAFERVRVATLEIAPRLSGSWLRGSPTLRIWADSELGLVDGRVTLGRDSRFVGRVSDVPLERLPLRLDSSGIALSGELDADADVGLDPAGVVVGRVDFESDSLVVQSTRLPIAVPFRRASGGVEVLESGATRIDGVRLQGDVVEGEIDGEIGFAHRSVSPPIDVTARIQIVEPSLRRLAPESGLRLSPQGEARVRVGGTLDRPQVEPLPAGRPG